MTKHLIVAGFTKCGTSLLNEVLKQTNEFATPKYIKEINFFNEHWDDSLGLDWYYKQYLEPGATLSDLPRDKVLVDASPTYLHNSYVKTLERIKSSLKKDVKILICLRNPVYRAFSHYIHNINAHFSHKGFFFRKQDRDFKEIYNQNFYEAFKNDHHLKDDYFGKISQAYQMFGKQNVMLFSLEKDAKNFDNFYQKLCQFCNVEYQPYFKDKPLPKVLAGNSIARYLYAKDKDLLVSHNNKIFSIDKDSLYLINSRKNQLFKHLSQQKVLDILSSSHNWTTFLHQEIAKKMFEQNFIKTAQEIENLVEGVDLSSWQVFKDKSIPPATFSPKYQYNGQSFRLKEVNYNLQSAKELATTVS